MVIRLALPPFKAPLLIVLLVLLLALCSVPLAFAVSLISSPWTNLPLLVSSFLITSSLFYFMSRIVKRLVAEHPVYGVS